MVALERMGDIPKYFRATVGGTLLGSAVFLGAHVHETLYTAPRVAQARADAGAITPPVDQSALREAQNIKTAYITHRNTGGESFDPAQDTAYATKPEVLQAKLIFDKNQVFLNTLNKIEQERGRLDIIDAVDTSVKAVGLIAAGVGAWASLMGGVAVHASRNRQRDRHAIIAAT